MKTKKEIRWVIVGTYGLYTGQWLTRKAAIFEHCRDMELGWVKCKKNGDRAIKVTITYK